MSRLLANNQHNQSIPLDFTFAIAPVPASLSQIPTFLFLIVIVLLRPPESQTFIKLARLALCASIYACILLGTLGSVNRGTCRGLGVMGPGVREVVRADFTLLALLREGVADTVAFVRRVREQHLSVNTQVQIGKIISTYCNFREFT